MIKSLNLICPNLYLARWTAGLACAIFGLSTSIGYAGEDFKKYETHKVLYVISESVETMSAPNDSGYATGTLKQGDVVDAYGEIGGKWLAIRPPVGQYDWLSAQDAHLLPGGRVAEIIDTPTPAWIHTEHKERSQFQWQVKLQPTQQVNVSSQFIQKLQNGQSRAWYRIDPPAGEFRWVSSDAFSNSPVKASLAKRSKSDEPSKTKVNSTDSSVQQASSTIVNVSSEPVVLGPGEVIVSHDQDPLWDAGDTTTEMVQGPTSVLVNEPASKPIVVDLSGGGIVGRIFGHAPTPSCPNCTPDACCSECAAGFNTPMHRIRPINKILSCIGISIVEAERPAVGLPCGGCGLPSCTSCNGMPAISHAGSIGSLPSRLDALPRPTRLGPETEYGDSIIVDRLSAARQGVGESIAQAKDRVEDRTQSLLANRLGTPIRDALTNRKPIFGSKGDESKDSNWQGLPQNGVSNEDLELNVEAPTSLSADPSAESSGKLLQTSSPTNRDQGSLSRPRNDDSVMEPSSAQLQRVAGELTTIVSMPTEQWKLSSLRDNVLQVIENGDDPVVRGEARLLLERIESFEDFRARWMRANSNKIVSTDSPSNVLTSNGSNRLAVQTASFQSRTSESNNAKPVVIKDMAAAQSIIQAADASGWLVAVHSEREDYPKFALTDDAGRLVTYVEAGPSLNLRGYLQQPVALHGQRGMNALLNARSIYAERVIRISEGK